MWDFIDKVVYINLEKRKDRNEHMKRMTETFGDKVIRFEAIEDNPGYLGCSRSHIEVVRMALSSNWKNVLILEDDAEWNSFESGYNKFKELSEKDYDVIVLGGSCVYRNGDRVYSSQCATGYLVNQHYLPKLLQNFENGYVNLETSRNYGMFALDQYWKHLQPHDNWFIVNPCLVYQRPDYSDIEKQYVDYRSAFHVL